MVLHKSESQDLVSGDFHLSFDKTAHQLKALVHKRHCTVAQRITKKPFRCPVALHVLFFQYNFLNSQKAKKSGKKQISNN